MRKNSVFLGGVAALLIFVTGATGSVDRAPFEQRSVRQRIVKISDASMLRYPGAEWLTQNGNLSNSRYSTLTQISPSNVKKLSVAWRTHINHGPYISVEAHPLVFGNTMLTTAGSVVAELDATTGALIRTFSGPVGISRGLAIGAGKIFAPAGPGFMGAWDVYTGQQVWKTQIVNPGAPATGNTAAPTEATYYNHMIIFGSGGNDGSSKIGVGADGFFNAYNADTGAPIWSWSVVPQKVGDPGASTWGDPAELGHGGGGDWEVGAIDAKHNLFFGGTGNASPYYGRSPGKDLYTTSEVALDLKTGKLKWYYQMIHHDMWDADCSSPPLLWDGKFHGKMTAGIEMTCKSRYYFEFNRVTGKPLIPVQEKPIPTLTTDPGAAAKSNAWPTQPVPKGDSIIPRCTNATLVPNPAPDGQPYEHSCNFAPISDKEFVAYAPMPLGGLNVMSYSPKLGYVYACDTWGVEAWKAIGPNTTININGPGSLPYTPPYPHFLTGVVTALNLQNNKIVWQKKWYADRDGMCYGGSVSTASGLVFVTSQLGYLYAYDAKTGKQRFGQNVCAGQSIGAPPMVYAVNGKEYVAVSCGGSSTGQLQKLNTTARQDETVVLSLPGS